MAASSCPSPLVNLGLPRTGTTSLHLAVKQLGLRSLHASDLDAATLGALAAAALDLHNSTLPALLNTTLASYDAVSSAPWFALAGVLPRHSLKFVATTRDEASWLASARWLFGDPLFRFGHPPAVQELLARYLGAPSDLARAFRRHDGALAALEAPRVDLRQTPRARWRALCGALLAPPACTSRTFRSMADCPERAPWPISSERGNDLEILGLSREQAVVLGKAVEVGEAADRAARRGRRRRRRRGRGGGAPLLATANVTVGAVVSREAREFLRDGVL